MTTAQYISKNFLYAIAEHIRTGVPASITLAQGIIESSSGNSVLSSTYKNDFGIKAYSNPKNLPVVYMNDDLQGEPFRVYSTHYQSYRDHSDFLTTNSRYAPAFNCTDSTCFANALQTAGYATSPTYSSSIQKVIADNNLSKYDYMGNHKGALSLVILLVIATIIFSILAYNENQKKISK